MKFIHLADLHLGKRVNGFSMLEDQRSVLGEILTILDRERPDALLIAGDVYDRPIPPEDAVGLFDGFLVDVARRGAEVFLISGNHDSAERVAFGGRLMDARGIHPAPVFDRCVAPILREDAWGPVAIYLFPFIKPAQVRRFWPEEEIVSYTDAVRAAIAHSGVDPAVRNIAVAHQFVTGATVCDSEEHLVGGLEQVDADVFAPFAYVALGHLHGPQCVGRPTLRYAGSPLKYSFSELAQTKGVTVVTLGAPGEVEVRLEPLHPRRDLRERRGSFAALTGPDAPSGGEREHYYRLVLTDEEDIPEALARLRAVYPNLMELAYDNTRTRAGTSALGAVAAENKSPLELFDELYALQNGQPMSEEQRRFARGLIEEIWEETV